MLEYILNGSWRLEIVGKDHGLIPEGSMAAAVPGSVYGALLENKLIPDPFYRDNELLVLPLMENDFVYSTVFEAAPELFDCDEAVLRFEGIDTLARIYLNGELLGQACNMHRIWEFDVLSLLRRGGNELRVEIDSPTKYIREENERVYTGGSGDSMEGFPHLRKAHCMFGWDWGPRLPDAGIFRTVSLLGVKNSRIDSVYVTQHHEEGAVTLDFDVTLELFGGSGSELMERAAQWDTTRIEVEVISPDGKKYYPNLSGMEPAKEASGEGYRIRITDPQLWWPRGYGEQPLYQVKVTALSKEGEVLEFGGLFGSGPVMSVNKYSSSKFISRGGRIPAPLQSLKN